MAKSKSKITRYIVITAVVLLVFVIIGKKAGWIGGREMPKVAIDKVQRNTIAETVSASGKIQPEIEVKISPDVSGEIVGLYVKEGDKVKKGDLLVKIKPDIYNSLLDRSNAAMNTAKANLANAQSRLVQVESQFKKVDISFTRSKKLHIDKLISDSEYESALSAYEVAKAEVDASRQSVVAARFNVASSQASVKESKDNLDKTTIFSPVDGTISRLNVELGERVVGTSQMAGTEIMRVANLTSMEVNVDVNENDINRISLGDTAIIEVDAFLDKKFKGIVTEIANSASILGSAVDQVTNFAVKIRILAEEDSAGLSAKKVTVFRPGLTATVEIQTQKMVNILTVPIQAVTTRSDSDQAKTPAITKNKTDKKNASPSTESENGLKECVFVFSNGKVKQVNVKTGIQDDINIEIKSGLKEGDEVVSAPYLAISKKLKNGDAVEKVDKEDLFTQEKK